MKSINIFVSICLSIVVLSCSPAEDQSLNSVSIPDSIPSEISTKPQQGAALTAQQIAAVKYLYKGKEIREASRFVVPKANESSTEREMREASVLNESSEVRELVSRLKVQCLIIRETEDRVGSLLNVNDRVNIKSRMGLTGGNCPLDFSNTNERLIVLKEWNPATRFKVTERSLKNHTIHQVKEYQLKNKSTILSSEVYLTTGERLENFGPGNFKSYIKGELVAQLKTVDDEVVEMTGKVEELSSDSSFTSVREESFYYRGTFYILTFVESKTDAKYEKTVYLNGSLFK